MLRNFFFLLSGEHQTLPFAELEAILTVEGITYRESQRLPQVFQIKTTIDAVGAVRKRAALTRICCQELFCCQASIKEIVKAMQSACLDDVLRPDESFVVRVKRVREATPGLVSVDLERRLGELLLYKVGAAKVNLKDPQKTFFGVMTGGRFLFGVKIAEISATPFVERRPRKRPFFHPSAMPAKLARCMVNLARPEENDLVLDPFCGTGSFLIEAGLMGCRVLGFDAKRHMVKGSQRNLKFYNIEYEGLVVADAKHLPITNVDCIVTDPPYGRSASTLGHTAEQIIQDFLTVVSQGKVVRKQRICIASPKTVQIEKTAGKAGLKIVQSHFIRVHRSLTRRIALLERA